MIIHINNNDISLWKYVYYSYIFNGNLVEDIISIDELTDNIFQSPAELANYCINPVEVPRVMNIMSRYSGYGINKLICIKSSYEVKSKDKSAKYDSGILLRFYIPNKLSESESIEIGSSDRPIYIFDSINVPKDRKDKENKCLARLVNLSSSDLTRRIYNGYTSREDIHESRYKRIFSVLFTTSDNPGVKSDLNSHLIHTYNVHQGQSAIDIVDLREGTYISKFLFDIFSMDKRLSCINGMIISSDFTKYYAGTYTLNDINYIISTSGDTISIGDGLLMYH